MGFGSGKTELGPEADPGEVGEFDVPLFNGYCSSEKRKIMKSMKLIFATVVLFWLRFYVKSILPFLLFSWL